MSTLGVVLLFVVLAGTAFFSGWNWHAVYVDRKRRKS
jgi:hypothetical protein